MAAKIKALISSNFIPLLVVMITFIITAIFSRIGVDPHHDGIVFKPAIDLVEGKMLFKDSFTQYGALFTIIQSLSLLIFGKYLIVIKLLTAFFYALTSFFLYKIWSIYEGERLSFFSCLLWLSLAPFYIFLFLCWSSVYALFFLVLSCYFLILSLSKHRFLNLFFVGISAGCTFWVRQPVGFFLIIFSCLSILLTIPKRQFSLPTIFKNILIYSLGLLAITLPILTWITVNGALRDWWLQSIKLAVVFGQTTGQNFQIKVILQNLFPGSADIISLWKLLPIIAVIYLTRSLIKKINKKDNYQDNVQIILSLISVSSWLQYYPVPCPRHLFWAVSPMIGILPKFLVEFQNTFIFNKNKHNLFISIIVFFLLLKLVVFEEVSNRLTWGINKLKTKYYTTNQPTVLKHMKISLEEVEFYQNSAKIFDTYPQKNVITNGPDAIYGALKPNSTNFHPMYVNWQGVNQTIYPEYKQRLTDYVKNDKPIIFSPAGDIMPDYCPIGKTNHNAQILTLPCELLKKTP